MTGVFDDFLPSLPKILDGLNSVKKKEGVRDAIRQIAETIYNHSSLYFLIARTVANDTLNLNSAYCRDDIQLESFLKREKSIDVSELQSPTWKALLDGKPLFFSEIKRKDMSFWGSPLEFPGSHLLLPLKISAGFVGYLEMGSDDIVEFSALANINDDIVIKLNVQLVELLSERINGVLNSIE